MDLFKKRLPLLPVKEQLNQTYQERAIFDAGAHQPPRSPDLTKCDFFGESKSRQERLLGLNAKNVSLCCISGV